MWCNTSRENKSGNSLVRTRVCASTSCFQLTATVPNYDSFVAWKERKEKHCSVLGFCFFLDNTIAFVLYNVKTHERDNNNRQRELLLCGRRSKHERDVKGSARSAVTSGGKFPGWCNTGEREKEKKEKKPTRSRWLFAPPKNNRVSLRLKVGKKNNYKERRVLPFFVPTKSTVLFFLNFSRGKKKTTHTQSVRF